MAVCVNLETCPFFQDRMANMPTTTELLKRKLCKADNAGCARFMVFQALGKGSVPPNLFPHQRDTATEIINKAKATGTVIVASL